MIQQRAGADAAPAPRWAPSLALTVPTASDKPMGRSSALARISSTARWVAVVAVVAAASVLIGAQALGYERYVVTGGSMTGTINRGALVFDRRVPTSSLRVGDVITYSPPPSSGVAGLVTHRIVRVGRDARGTRVFRTKGDANPQIDPWRFKLHAARQARVSFQLPYAGYVLAAASLRPVRVLLIGLPALAVAVALLVGLWRETAEAAPRAGAREP